MSVTLYRDGEIYGEHGGNTKPKKVMFGIGKKGVQRAVVQFREKPPSRPLHVSFDFPNSSLTHAYVYNNIKQMITTEGAAITGMQYQDRNVLFGARTAENRWIISVNSVEARDELIKLGLVIFSRKIKVKKYDDMVEEDYADFVRNNKMQKGIMELGGRPEAPAGGSRPSATPRKSLRGGSIA